MAQTLSDLGLTYGASTTLAAASQHLSVGASVASNAITVTLDPCVLSFRSATLTSGAVSALNVSSQISLVIAATDSFGAVTAAGTQRIAILAINNAGTVELAASNLVGGGVLDETNVITTATTATTATAIKAAAVRSNVAYRVVGYVDVPFTTATGYGAIVEVQSIGGQALTAMSSLGYGQTWQNVSGTRAFSTTYYNTTGKPIFVHCSVNGPSVGNAMTLTINGVALWSGLAAAGNYDTAISGIVPPGGTYVIASPGGGSIRFWAELR